MSALLLASAQTILAKALEYARGKQFKPMAIVVLDARGSLVAAATEDGNALGRWQVAFGKAYGALFMGAGSRRLAAMASERPHFIGALAHLPAAGLIPVAGGVLIRDGQGEIVGAVGVSGDTSDNDEAAGAAGVVAAGFAADGG
jgi:uncharacterized protein GlcG (DUF336 family)